MKNISLSCLTVCYSLILCLSLAGNASCKSDPAKNGPVKYILLPEPQHVDYLPGIHRLKPGRLIFLDTSASDRLFGIGRIVQESLTQVGPRWELTAAQGREPQLIGATVTVDPSQIRQPQ
jgi:hypothetical protein